MRECQVISCHVALTQGVDVFFVSWGSKNRISNRKIYCYFSLEILALVQWVLKLLMHNGEISRH